MRVINCGSRKTAHRTGSISNNNPLSASDCNSLVGEVSVGLKKSKCVIVTFKSAITHDHVIDRERIKRDLFVHEVFANNMITIVYQ